MEGLRQVKERGGSTPWWMIEVTEEDLFKDDGLAADTRSMQKDPELEQLLERLEKEWT